MYKFIVLIFYLILIGCDLGEDSVKNDIQIEECLEQLDYNASAQQAYYTFLNVTLNNVPIDSLDWVGVYNGDVCVGSFKWNTELCNNDVCSVVANGYNSFTESLTSNYCRSGDMPTFKIYDNSENKIYDTHIKNFSGDIIDAPQWNNLGLYICDSLIALPNTDINCQD